MNYLSMSKFNSIIVKLFGMMSPRLSLGVSYIHNRGRIPDFRHPKDLSELWVNKLLGGEINEMYYLADKYKVRDYVKEKGLGRILVPLLGVWNNAYDIDFDKLPARFALKLNYGAAMNIVTRDKSSLNQDEARSQLQEWLEQKKNYSYTERHYDLIDRKIVCEEFIEDEHGGFPYDYKIICIKGQPACVLACTGRLSGHANYSPYSVDWKPLPGYYKSGVVEEIEPPHHLKEMLSVASKLAEGIDLVRVDLYDTKDHIYFGEMTLTPSGCIFHRWSNKAMDEMGALYNNTSVNFGV